MKEPCYKNLKWYIETQIQGDDIIISEGFSDIAFERTKMIIRTKEESVRQALMKLGWTPPHSTEHPVDN